MVCRQQKDNIAQDSYGFKLNLRKEKKFQPTENWKLSPLQEFKSLTSTWRNEGINTAKRSVWVEPRPMLHESPQNGNRIMKQEGKCSSLYWHEWVSLSVSQSLIRSVREWVTESMNQWVHVCERKQMISILSLFRYFTCLLHYRHIW